MKSDLKYLFDEALTHIPDPKLGLPQEAFYFISQMTPMINVDLLIKNKKGQTLLTWREDEFYGPAWHIPGGIIRFKEHIETRLNKVAEIELGCSIKFNPEPITVSSLINNTRDIRGHFISLLYLCEVTREPDMAKKCISNQPTQGQWKWHDASPSNLLSVHESFRVYIDDTKPL